MKKIISVLLVMVLSAGFSGLAAAGSTFNIKPKLTVTLSPEKDKLLAVYEVENLTSGIITHSQDDEYRYAINLVYSDNGYVEVATGNMDNAYSANVSQYLVGGSHAVFAVKEIAITQEMKDNPGFYRMFLSASGPNVYPVETVFYIPEGLDAYEEKNIESIYDLVLETRTRLEYLFSRAMPVLRQARNYARYAYVYAYWAYRYVR